MPKPAKTAKKCTLDQFPGHDSKLSKDFVSIFEMKQMQGWWPLVKSDDNPEITVNLSFTLQLSRIYL